ncbi:diacylglycerol kinase family protein [Actinopolymorpha sp. B11F2]|uniref:diacylglycerol kinase family protein n=1 Tax=Actinopolymorpha sp. B11F2 TaxID=3160862 RepID=UPI0032E4B9F0
MRPPHVATHRRGPTRHGLSGLDLAGGGLSGIGAPVAICVGGVGFVVLLVLVQSGWAPLVGFDRNVAAELSADLAAHPALVGLFVVVQELTQPWVLRGTVVIVAALLIRRGRAHQDTIDRGLTPQAFVRQDLIRLGWWLVAVVIAGAGAEYVFKRAVARPRPQVSDGLVEIGGHGFPSGHALGSALLVGALLIVVSQLNVTRRLLITLWTSGACVVVLVGFDRVVLGVHHVSDVLAGWCLAAALLGATTAAFGIGQARTRIPRRRGRSRQRVAVIVNPSKIDDAAAFRAQVERHAAREGWATPLWFETTRDDPGQEMIRAAVDADVKLVIAAGGDGTVRVVCAGLAGTGVPLGIVPVGTGNLLVRNLGLPLDRAAALRVAFTGQDRQLDLVRVEGDGVPTDRFAVMAGLGLDAAVVGEAPPKLKARMGWGAYVVSIARNLSFPAVRAEISVDDEPPVRLRVRTVLIGNVGTLHAGLSLLPDARPDDGMLDVVAVAPRRLTDWPGLAWRVVSRSAAQDDRLRTWRGERVVVRSVEACPRQLDGDVISTGHELRCEVEPGVLLVRVPRRANF